jgi:3-methyl-2-oxobutanoate hydroxymethyltransferase
MSTLAELTDKKARREPIVMVTAYDFPSARAAERAGVDLVLVGDTAATTVLGHPSTVYVSLDEMLVLAASVRRELRHPLLIGDLPMGSYERSDETAIASAQRYIKLGCDVVKLEGGGPMSLSRVSALVAAGIPVMGHVGVTPQTATALSGFRARGRSVEQALSLVDQAERLERAGCFALVLEAVAAEVAETITQRLSIPTIGIGAGPATDGQVLVFNDLVGLYEDPPRFVRRYAQLARDMDAAVAAYAHEVRAREFPTDAHMYSMEPAAVDQFRQTLSGR